MRRRQIYAERYPAILDIPPEAQEEAARVLLNVRAEDIGGRTEGECPKCLKRGLKNVGAHRRFCKG
jgi:hypothetical protein